MPKRTQITVTAQGRAAPAHAAARTSIDIELRLLMEAIYLKYGYDFRNYSRASAGALEALLMLRTELSGWLKSGSQAVSCTGGSSRMPTGSDL